jgi:hypothetical protein
MNSLKAIAKMIPNRKESERVSGIMIFLVRMIQMVQTKTQTNEREFSGKWLIMK